MKLLISNENDSNLEVYLEPWGDEFLIEPKGELMFIGKNVFEDGYFNVVHNKFDLIIYAEWRGALVDVFDKDGNNVSNNSNSIQLGDY